LNAINPEALVVRRNVSRAVTAGKFDASALNSLTDDAVPALAALLPRLNPAETAASRSWLCTASDAKHGVFGYNVSSASASAARSRVCDRRSP
jgi:hypothetical protein